MGGGEEVAPPAHLAWLNPWEEGTSRLDPVVRWPLQRRLDDVQFEGTIVRHTLFNSHLAVARRTGLPRDHRRACKVIRRVCD